MRVKGNVDMREAARNLFSRLYEQDFMKRPRLHGLNFRRLFAVSSQSLEAIFTEEEIY